MKTIKMLFGASLIVFSFVCIGIVEASRLWRIAKGKSVSENDAFRTFLLVWEDIKREHGVA